MDGWLSIEGVKVHFPVRRGVWARKTGVVHAVDGVTLSLAKGETLGLAGESGCGKTTLGRVLTGLERPTEGTVRLDGAVLAEAGRNTRLPKALRRRIQMVFQDPMAALNPRLPVCDLLTEGMVEHGLLHGETREEAAARLLAEVGLDAGARWKYPFEFSGGQRQRICIARAIALEPDLVVCDEVVSALDVSVQAQVLNLLMELRARRGLSYVVISHDLSVLRHISHRLAVMYLGRLAETGPAADLIDAPLHPYTRALVAAVPIPGIDRPRRVLSGEPPSAARPPAGCPFHPRCPRARPLCKETPPPAVEAGAGHWVCCHFPGED